MPGKSERKKPKPNPLRKNKHHLWEPECDYTPKSEDDIEGKIAERFRKHSAFIVEAYVDGHDLYNQYKQVPRKPPLRVMKKFLEEHPEKLYKPTRTPAQIVTQSISRVKNILGIVFTSLAGQKQVIKIGCANCKNNCFEPVVEIVEAEPAPTKPVRKH